MACHPTLLCLCLRLCTGSHLDLGLDLKLGLGLLVRGTRHGMAWARHGCTGRWETGMIGEGHIRQETAEISTSTKWPLQVSRGPKSVCPSGGSLRYPTSGHWALGGSGCGVTLPCARLFFSSFDEREDSDQISPAESGVSGCGWG